MRAPALVTAASVSPSDAGKPAGPDSAKPDAAKPDLDDLDPLKLGFMKPPADAAKPPEPVKPRAEPAKPRQDSARRDTRARVCFNPAETREKIATHHLAEPVRALRAGRQQGEALRARLCRWKQDDFVYDIFVLRRDGRVIHVYMNAENGQAVGALTDSDLK